MARTAQGWQLKRRKGSGIFFVRFSHQSERYFVSCRTRDPGEASLIAAQIYRVVVDGKITRATSINAKTLIHPGSPLDELAAKWLVAVAPELGDGTDRTFEVYVRHWLRYFPTLAQLSDASCANYARDRLRFVQATTVRKEISALRRFLRWLEEQNFITSAPTVMALPKKALGTKRESSRPRAAELSVEEVRAILAALPKRSKDIPVRAYCTFAYETALRPEGTLEKLEWRDVTAFGLHIRPECDKNRWERTIPLSAAARAALDYIKTPLSRPNGLIFGSHDFRMSFKMAVIAALSEERVGATVYALKHARITHWFDEGAPVTAIKFLTGITQTSTLDRYARASRRAAEQLVEKKNSGANVVQSKVPECEGEDLNLHGSYPTSTSSWMGPQIPAENGVSVIWSSVNFSQVDALSGALHQPARPYVSRARRG